MFIVKIGNFLKSAIKNAIIIIEFFVTKREKLFLKLFRSPQETSLRDIEKVLNCFGYEKARIRGSHHIFRKGNHATIVLPVHNNMIKKTYIKKVTKILNEGREL